MITSATAITPASSLSLAKRSGVFPCSARASARKTSSPGTSTRPLTYFRLPPSSTAPSSLAERPLPGRAVNSVTSAAERPSSSALAMTAFARGCSLFFSRAQASRKRASSVNPGAGRISVTLGSPLVIVPVLSRATISIFPVSSRDTAFLKRMPFLAPIPFPTMMATGVANPRAQGQLITRTEIPRARAKPKLSPAISHTRAVTAATAITAGTKMPDTLSATLAIGALVAAASLTMRMIWERVVSSPTFVARHLRKPDWFTVAADTSSPSPLSTGMLSPVSAASFTALDPSRITPSTGIFSPGRTTKRSPFFTCLMGTVCSAPSFKITAVLGASFIRLFRASVVFPLERASSIFPTVISVRIMAADSK